MNVFVAGKRDHMEDRSCIIPDFRPLGTPDSPENAATTFAGVFDGHLSAKASEMAANNLHSYLAKGDTLTHAPEPDQCVDSGPDSPYKAGVLLPTITQQVLTPALLTAEPGYLGSIARTNPLQPLAVSEALQKAFQRCDREILEASRSEENWKGGSTACISLSIDAVSRQIHPCIDHALSKGLMMCQHG